MFHVVKHTPTNTWVPHLQSPRERSNYYLFLEGKSPTKGSGFTASQLDFYKAFKYKEKPLAETFITAVSKKLHFDRQDATAIASQFVIETYEKWPIELIKLSNKDNKLTANLKIETVDHDWIDQSKIYCQCCNSLIAPGMKYLLILNTKICPFCLLEAISPVKDNIEMFQDKELLEAIRSERFVNKI